MRVYVCTRHLCMVLDVYVYFVLWISVIVIVK